MHVTHIKRTYEICNRYIIAITIIIFLITKSFKNLFIYKRIFIFNCMLPVIDLD